MTIHTAWPARPGAQTHSQRANRGAPTGDRGLVRPPPGSALLPEPRSLACTNAALVGVDRFSHVWRRFKNVRWGEVPGQQA